MKKFLLLIIIALISIDLSWSARRSTTNVFAAVKQPVDLSVVQLATASVYKVTIQMGSSFLNMYYNYGETPSFDFTPPPGIKLQTVTNNGLDVTNQLVDNVYTLPPITGNVLLVVSTISVSTSIADKVQSAVRVYNNSGNIAIEGLVNGDHVSVYNMTGKLIGSFTASNDQMSLSFDKLKLYIVKVNQKAFKVIL